ncbi:uncharacterized protein A4U43_C05F1360 [Asparagus officinalis]|uniref:Bet v I/Major latex protein domain-containing protein n=1 Tax=Asparagus officinalis TaxID=4686 RepID=A0A5P1ENI8_ASPOF|nr:pathogenesis-related protein 1-like [Asparagus officinalis]ONK67565.1 uncharacterized protein A4U43_C05F1360 [Asparagus officinalis]
MGSKSFSQEIQTSVSADRMFKAFVMDWHNLAPKVMPDKVESVKAVEGQGGPGSIRQINFTSAMPFSYVKERLDAIDKNKLECKNTLLEGGDIGTKIESACSHMKFVPTSGGCTVKVETTYKTLPGVAESDEAKKAQEGLAASLKAVEKYLVEHPSA